MVATAVLAFIGVGHLRDASPGYREAVVTDQRPLSLNPLLGASDPPVRDLGELLYRRLLKLDQRALPVPDLASSLTVSPDGRTYHLPLRSGQRWSDGRPITTADAVATLQFIQQPGYPDAAVAAQWRAVHARPDGDGVTFDLPAPRAAFAAALTQLPILPLGGRSPASLAALVREAALPLPSSGAFRVVRSDAAAVVLFPNSHALVRPHLNQVELDLYATFAEAAAAYRQGTADAVLATTPEQRDRLLAMGGMPHSITTFRFVDLLFNERNPVLADPAVRAAVSQAIDRGRLVSGALQNMALPEPGPVPRGILWAAASGGTSAAAPGEAAAALGAAGWQPGADGVRSRGSLRLEVGLIVPAVQPLPALADAIRTQLQAIGMHVVIRAESASAVRAAVTAASFDTAVADWDLGPDPDVSSFWRSTAVPPGGYSVSGGPPSPFLDQALDRLATVTDLEVRMAAVREVGAQLADSLPAVFLDTPRETLVTHGPVQVVLPSVGDSGARFARIELWARS